MKRIITLSLALIVIVSSLIVPVSAAEDVLLIAPNPNAAKNTDEIYTKSLKTSLDQLNNFEFAIEENVLRISGIILNEEINYVYIDYVGEHALVKVAAGSRFSAKIDLSSIEAEEFSLNIYTGKSKSDQFVSAFYGEDIVIHHEKDGWGIILNNKIYEHNKGALAGWIDEKSAIETDIPDRIKKAAESVAAGLETDYEKARAIHMYVADTLYYDLDYAQHVASSTAVSAQDVYDKGYAVCEGYSNLTLAMLHSVGIPAVFVEGYALGVGNSVVGWEGADTLSSNHAWVEAYIDGRWVIMDPTWDSKNTLTNGKKETFKTDFYRFFDASPEMLSVGHKIIRRPNTFGNTGVSSWALEECQEAFRAGLVTQSVRYTMTNSISRAEFCSLLMNMLSKKLGKSVDKILADKNLVINEDVFDDTSSKDVFAAYALGIVNGKGGKTFDPSGTIKRQEAAAMLQRAAINVLGVTKTNSSAVEFTDSDTFDTWGRDAIAFVSASVDKSGRKVMGGKEEGRFAPHDLYTKEQSVLTVLRLYNAY